MITYIIQDEYNRIWAIFEDESEAKWFMKILQKDKNCDRIFSMQMWIVAQKGLSKKGYRQVAKRCIEKDNDLMANGWGF